MKRITRSVDETLLLTTCYLQGTNQSKVQTQRVNPLLLQKYRTLIPSNSSQTNVCGAKRVRNGNHVSVPIKHLDIRVTSNPGTRGRISPFCDGINPLGYW